MTAVVRLALYYFVLYRVQRWLLAIGAGILVLGLATDRVDDAIFVAILLIQGLAVPLAALTFREVSMRQAVSLAPRFRLRMLASLLVFASLVALAAAVLAPGRTAAVTSFPTLLAVHFAFVSLGVLVIALLPVSLAWWWLSVWIYLPLRLPLEAVGYRWLMRTGVDPVLPVLVICVLAWAGFASWYLTTPAIGRARRVRSFFSPAPWPVGEGAVFTPERAAAFLLSGGVVVGWRQWLVVGGAGACVLWLLTWLLTVVLPPDAIARFPFTMSFPLVGSAASDAIVEAQRARMLWLTHGSRTEIFHLCERGALRHCAALTAAMAFLAAYAWVSGLVGLPGAIWLVAFGASLTCAATYLGLLFVAGRHRSRLVLTGAFLVSWIASIGLAAAALDGAGVAPALLVLPLVALVAEGLVCRRLARRRWERIDWLRQRPIRWLTPPSPRVRYGR